MAWHPFRNLGLKTAALALGTLLWFAVSGEEVERLVGYVSARQLSEVMERVLGDEASI